MRIFAFLFLFLIYFFPVFGQQNENDLKIKIEEKNKEIELLEEEIKEYQISLEKTADTSKTLNEEIKQFENQIKNLNIQIELTKSKISKKELEIENLESQITKTEISFNEQKKILAKNLRELDQIESQNIVEMFLIYDSLSGFFEKLEQNKKIGTSIEKSLNSLKEIKTSLKNQKNESEQAKKSLQNLNTELIGRKKIQQDEKSAKNNLLLITKNKESEYQKLLKIRETQRNETLKEIQKIEDELRASIDPSSIPQAHSGVLNWPILGAVLTQGFGNTPYSKILYNGQPHNGIDIKAPVGTLVFSAEKGIIKEIGDTDIFGKGTSHPCLSYGKWVLIEHQNNLSTLYAHLSLITVKRGDIVEREERIGYSGKTGYALGPHLHFTVYDSHTVKFGPSQNSNSTCQFLPFGGYLNPLAYL